MSDPKQTQGEIEKAISERIVPPLPVTIDTVETEGVKVLRLQVTKGSDRPYCLDEQKFYVRDEGDTNLAVRDEVVALVLEAQKDQPSQQQSKSASSRWWQ